MVSTEYDYNFKLLFHAEWFDPLAQLTKKFVFRFYPSDNTVELFDLDKNRIYLKRASYEGLRLKDIFAGNILTIYGRQIRLTDYADCTTQKFIGKWKEHTFAIIKPSGMNNLGVILDEIYKNNLTVDRMRMAHLSRKETLDFYEDMKGEAFLPFIIEHISSAPLVAMEIVGENSIERWREMMGPRDPADARKTAPNTFRARFGTDLTLNVVHGANNPKEALRNACFFFPQGIDRKPPRTTAKIQNSTLCVVKPHAIDEGKLGRIIDYILKEKFIITALQMFYLSSENVDEFLEVYKGIVTDFRAMLTSFLDGPCVALEISGKEENMDVHQEFRKFCGPSDSDIARQIRPRTLRGVFGVSKYKNAVHCTDLAEDTQLELEYFFKILND